MAAEAPHRHAHRTGGGHRYEHTHADDGPGHTHPDPYDPGGPLSLGPSDPHRSPPYERDDTAVKPMTPAQLRQHLHRILVKALHMGVADQVERVEYGLYLVPSTSERNTVHTVTDRDDGTLACSCQAYAHMPLCVHRAAVWIRRWRADDKEVALDGVGDVVVVSRQDAAALVYPPELWPRLVLEDREPEPEGENELCLSSSPESPSSSASTLLDNPLDAILPERW